jgi:hypothetical protein
MSEHLSSPRISRRSLLRGGAAAAVVVVVVVVVVGLPLPPTPLARTTHRRPARPQRHTRQPGGRRGGHRERPRQPRSLRGPYRALGRGQSPPPAPAPRRLPGDRFSSDPVSGEEVAGGLVKCCGELGVRIAAKRAVSARKWAPPMVPKSGAASTGSLLMRANSMQRTILSLRPWPGENATAACPQPPTSTSFARTSRHSSQTQPRPCSPLTSPALT